MILFKTIYQCYLYACFSSNLMFQKLLKLPMLICFKLLSFWLFHFNRLTKLPFLRGWDLSLFILIASPNFFFWGDGTLVYSVYHYYLSYTVSHCLNTSFCILQPLFILIASPSSLFWGWNFRYFFDDDFNIFCLKSCVYLRKC